MSWTARTAALAVGVLALTGCTGDPEPPAPGSASPSPSVSSSTPEPSPSSSSPAASPSVSPSVVASTSPSTREPAEGFSFEDVTSAGFPDLGGALGTQGTVRVGRHEGFTRVVWEFPGTGAPNYRVRYVDVPLGDGSGDPVEVKGDAWLEVLVSRLDSPDGASSCPKEAPDSMLAGTPVRQALAFCGGFEGMGQAFVGLDERRSFEVTVLTAPTRLVVDIADD